MRGVHLASYRPVPTSASPGRAVGAAAVAIVAGLVVGIGTQVLQGVLPDSGGVLANSGVVWALGAFAVGTLMPSVRAAALGGATTMVLASLSYYWAVDWFEGISSQGRGALIWSVAGLVAGPVFGVAGHLVKSRPDVRWLALAPVAGALIGEGAHLVWFVGVDDLWPAGVVEMTLGAAVTMACAWRDRRPILVLGAVAAAVAVHRLALSVLDAGFSIPI
ncbi:MAG: hypothetical protein H0X22_13370 [Acidimicrobiia bacterium]|nr:hypothetical protein [Acidimicrobiia bacterium]